jgi:hypothetical protein
MLVMCARSIVLNALAPARGLVKEPEMWSGETPEE